MRGNVVTDLNNENLNIKFIQGDKKQLPNTFTPGALYVVIDTGELYLDTDTARI
jgi:hypothetical protein